MPRQAPACMACQRHTAAAGPAYIPVWCIAEHGTARGHGVNSMSSISSYAARTILTPGSAVQVYLAIDALISRGSLDVVQAVLDCNSVLDAFSSDPMKQRKMKALQEKARAAAQEQEPGSPTKQINRCGSVSLRGLPGVLHAIRHTEVAQNC
jgi:hypothetical protein